MNFNAKALVHSVEFAERSVPCRNGSHHLYRDIICTCCSKRITSRAPLHLLDRRLRSLYRASKVVTCCFAEDTRLIFIIHEIPLMFHHGKIMNASLIILYYSEQTRQRFYQAIMFSSRNIFLMLLNISLNIF